MVRLSQLRKKLTCSLYETVMSDSEITAFVQAEVDQWYPAIVENYTQLAAFVLVVYDHILTLSLEISEIWPKKFGLVKGLFLMSRYSLLLVQVFATLYTFQGATVTDSCNVTYRIFDVLQILVQLAVVGIFTLRVYAIYGRNNLILIMLGLPGLAAVALSVRAAIIGSSVALPTVVQLGPFRCEENELNSIEDNNFITAGWALGIVFDTLVVILTIARTLRLAIQSRKLDLKDSLVLLILRDGIFFYLVIFVPELIQLILTIVSTKISNINFGYSTSDLGAIVSSLQLVMTNRLVLNLSHVAALSGPRSDRSIAAHSRSGLTAPAFAHNSILENIGASISIAENNISEEDPKAAEMKSVKHSKAALVESP